MPDNENEKQSVENNAKAVKFQNHLMDSDINAFATESLDDEQATVIFRSRVEIDGQRLPMAIVIDTSPYVIIRVEIVSGVKNERRDTIRDHINTLNSRYKLFKYYMREDGLVYNDVCIPFTDETFDGAVVINILNVLINHLNEVYGDFMERVWSKS